MLWLEWFFLTVYLAFEVGIKVFPLIKKQSVIYTHSHLCKSAGHQITLSVRKIIERDLCTNSRGEVEASIAQWCVTQLRLKDHGKCAALDGISGRLSSHMLYACSVWPVTCGSRLQFIRQLSLMSTYISQALNNAISFADNALALWVSLYCIAFKCVQVMCVRRHDDRITYRIPYQREANVKKKKKKNGKMQEIKSRWPNSPP